MGELAEPHRSLLRELAGRPDGIWVTCAGRSMEPTIRRGDRVRVCAELPVREGDVALFEIAGGALVLHRVILAVPGLPWLVHLGDAWNAQEPSLAHRRTVVGRAALPRRWPDPSDRMRALRRVLDAAWQLGRRRLENQTRRRDV